ncbi:MAG: hypothetical protein AAF921_13250 [Cyanobacteria bacterium P01_D01_bin.44]
MKWNLLKWKPLKWGIIGLLAMIWALVIGSSYLPAQASPVYQDTFKIGGDLVVTEDQTVRDAFAIGGDVTVQAGASVQGDTFAIGGNLQLEDNTQVKGDAFAIGGQLIRAESAMVNGNEFTMLESFSGLFERFGVLGTLYLGNVIFWLGSFVIAAIAGLLLLSLLPRHVNAIATTVHTHPFNSLLYGLGGIAALTVLSVLISGSVLGALLLPLVNLAALLTGLLGYIAICVWLGKQLQPQKPEAHFRHFWLGLLLLFVVSLLPIVGGLLVSFISLFGFGATLLARYGTQPNVHLPVTIDGLDYQTE